MSFTLSLSLFFIVAVFYVFITDVFTMLFRLTGMTQEKARFQVISLLTNSGYTTKESELVVDVLSRRKLARAIMLFGYVFSITIVSVFVNVMMALPQSEKEEVWPALITVSVLFLIFFIVRRVPVVKEAFNQLLQQWARRWYLGAENNPILVQDEYPHGVIAQVTLNVIPKTFKDTTLGDLQLRASQGVNIIFIRRGDEIITKIGRDTALQLGDQVTVFGTENAVKQVFGASDSYVDPMKEAAPPLSEQEYFHQQAEKAAAEAAQAEQAQSGQASKAVRADDPGASARPENSADSGSPKDVQTKPKANP